MSIFKRLSATLVSSLDSMVAEIEDHSAVVEVAIKDLQKQLAQTRVKHQGLQHEYANINKQIDEGLRQVDIWKMRAKEVAVNDEEKALQCLSRAKNARQQVEQLTQSAAQYQQTIQKISDSLELLQKSLQEAKHKHALMKAREVSGNAIASNASLQTDMATELKDTFERWEINLLNAEMHLNEEPFSVADSLEDEFKQSEAHRALKQELAVLMQENHHD